MTATRITTRPTSRALAGLVLVLALGACGDDAADGPVATPPTTDQPSAPKPDGTWRAVSGTIDGASVDVDVGNDVTLTIDGDEIGGVAACNHYGGTADVGDGTIAIGALSMTEMGCREPLMQLESTFLQSLARISTYALADGRLTLAGDGVEWEFEVVPPVPEADIVGTTWVLDTYLHDDVASSLPFMELATLTLNGDGTLSGSTSCRRLEGEWTIEGAQVVFTTFAAIDDPLAGVCAPESEALDQIVVRVLGDGFTVEVEGDRLTVRSQGGEGLSLVADS